MSYYFLEVLWRFKIKKKIQYQENSKYSLNGVILQWVYKDIIIIKISLDVVVHACNPNY
jgi:hypothetical protein